MCSANRARADFAEPDAADFASVDELAEGADRGLDGYFGVNTCHAEDIELLLPIKGFEGLLGRSADGFWSARRVF